MTAESLLLVANPSDIESILKGGKPAVKPKEEDLPLDWYFPQVDPGMAPFGERVLVQLKRTKNKSAGGIILAEDTKANEKWNNQIAQVVEVGPIAYRNRDSGNEWKEGAWCKVGDYVRVPRWGGDKWEMPVGDGDDQVVFALFKDHEIGAQITIDPRHIKTFIL